MVLRSSGGPGAPGGAPWPSGRRWRHVGVTYTRNELRFFEDGKLTKSFTP